MAFGLRATFPLGYYQGHDWDGSSEKYPHLTRVQSALIDAAYSLARLDSDTKGCGMGDEGNVDEASSLPKLLAESLRWLEANPPDALVLPDTIKSDETTVAFRRTGPGFVKDNETKKYKAANLERPATSRTMLSGPVEWWWEKEPPEGIADAIGQLAFEVPYLGETDSVVRIAAVSGDALPNVRWNRVLADGLHNEVSSLYLYAPKTGRLDGIQKHFLEHRKEKFKPKESEPKEIRERVFRDMEERHYYSREDEGAPIGLPWAKGYIVDVVPSHDGEAQWPPSDDRKLAWAVAFHRALVRKCGDDPPLILKHRKGRIRAGANGVAIQIVDEAMPLAQGLNAAGAAFLVMLPSDAPADEAYAVERALGSVRRIFGRGLGALDIEGTPRSIDPSKLWRDCEDGMERWWCPSPLWVADNRPPTRRGGEEWTLADSVRVSVGYVFREAVWESRTSAGEIEPPQSQTHDERLRRLSRDMDAMGVKVAGARPLHPNRPGDYLHHMNKGSFFSAGTFLCSLGTLAGGTAVLAVGQTRHLGGGLLVPVDIPASPAASAFRGGD